jgi:hypothetical protein
MSKPTDQHEYHIGTGTSFTEQIDEQLIGNVLLLKKAGTVW